MELPLWVIILNIVGGVTLMASIILSMHFEAKSKREWHDDV